MCERSVFMSTRVEIVNSFYNQINEDQRVVRSRHGQLEYATTMHYIHQYAGTKSKILEIGAGTGRYSIALAKEGHAVTAVELVKNNLNVLRENGKDVKSLEAFQGDATDLSLLNDSSFDVTIVLGPLYHLYEPEDVHKAVDEAIRVTRPGGVLMFAFISVYAIMYSNYFQNNWLEGEKENFTQNYEIRHFKEQLFTGYDVKEFEDLFRNKPVEWIATTGTDGMLEAIEPRDDFEMKEEDFQSFLQWYLRFSEKRELLGSNNHLLYICRKKESIGGSTEERIGK